MNASKKKRQPPTLVRGSNRTIPEWVVRRNTGIRRRKEREASGEVIDHDREKKRRNDMRAQATRQRRERYNKARAVDTTSRDNKRSYRLKLYSKNPLINPLLERDNVYLVGRMLNIYEPCKYSMSTDDPIAVPCSQADWSSSTADISDAQMTSTGIDARDIMLCSNLDYENGRAKIWMNFRAPDNKKFFSVRDVYVCIVTMERATREKSTWQEASPDRYHVFFEGLSICADGAANTFVVHWGH
jgi:hypothetical protein